MKNINEWVNDISFMVMHICTDFYPFLPTKNIFKFIHALHLAWHRAIVA